MPTTDPMNGLRKAAIAVMALGSELAGRIFTLLSPDEVAVHSGTVATNPAAESP